MHAGSMGFQAGETHTVVCTEPCGGAVWGCPQNSGWLTHDSTICRAAEMLTIPLGTPFQVVMTGSQTSYPSCTMNGITSSTWGNWHISYRIDLGKSLKSNVAKSDAVLI